MQNRKLHKTKQAITLNLSIVILMAALFIRTVPPVSAATGLSNRYDRISDSLINAIATHNIGFTFTNTTTPVGSVQFEFCSNDPIPGTPCTPPDGFDILSSDFSDQSGETGFTVSSLSSTHNIILTRTASVPTALVSEYTFDEVKNPSTRGTYYIRVMTYQSDDATGPTIEEGGIAVVANRPYTITTEVPPYLRFCTGVTINALDCSTATGSLLDFGEFSTSAAKSVSSQMVAATNAESGYSITLSGKTLISGNNIIPAMSTTGTSSPGVGQFGINLRANTSPLVGNDPTGSGIGSVTNGYNLANRYRFIPGEVIASSPKPSRDNKFTVSYITNISPEQKPGVYATTITFICLANF